MAVTPDAADSTGALRRRSVAETLAVYLKRRVLIVAFLGFSSGLPLALSGSTLLVWMREVGVNLGTIGLFALVGTPYTVKFLWAPLVDALDVPVLSRRFGRRRGWLLLAQLLLMAAIVCLGACDPAVSPLIVAVGALLVATASDARTRSRILVLGLVAVIAVALLVVAMVSVDSVREMFIERAKAIQPYDVGPGGRFWEQRLALGVILDHPNGLGPFEFGRLFGTQQHDVYMQGFLVYGWLGGTAYLTLVAVTLGIGLRAALVSAPWQNYLIAAYAGFVGEACEGFIVDTDHWRHFFLLLGLVWGLTVATINNGRRQARYYALAPGLERHAAPAAGAA